MSALPPVVVSGLPNMTPIFSRSWLMKTTALLERLMAPASFRSAWLMSRAWRPMMAVAHLAFDFGLGHQRRDRVDDHEVHRAGADQDLDDLERLLAGVGLGDQEVLDVDAELLGVLDVERVLGVHVGGDAAHPLHVGREVEGERGLARGLGAVDLGDPAAGHAADAGGGVEVDGAGGDGGDLDPGGVGAHPHDGALAELLLDLGDGEPERLPAVGFEPGFVSGHGVLW